MSPQGKVVDLFKVANTSAFINTTMVLHKDEIKLIFCAGGIYTAYIWYGLCQEDLFVYICSGAFLSKSSYYCFRYSQTFGSDKNKFTFSIFVLLVQAIVASLAAFLGSSTIVQKSVIY